MRRLSIAALATMLGLASSAPLLAQRTTGGISGTVKDATGAVLPGVAVTVSGANIAGAQSATTNESGYYRFVSLPPGEYELKFGRSGFKTETRRGIRVPLGVTLEENAALAVSQLEEQVDVVAETAVVDTSSNEVGSNLDRNWIENAPTRRFSFFDLVAHAPGSLAAGDGGGAHGGSTRTMVYGSSYDENAFQLDGVDITDNFFNEAAAEPNTDAIEEIEVLSLGAPAEFGNLQGAVYNIVTRQGTNAFHGDLSFYYQSDGLTGRNTTDEQDGGFPYRRDKYTDLSAQLGGPIVKDKLWFFGSYQNQRDGASYATFDPSTRTGLDSTDRFLGKLTWQLNPKHKLVANFNYDKGEQEQYALTLPTQAGIEPMTRFNKTPAPGVAYTGVLSDKTVLDVRYSGFYSDVSGFPTDPNAPLSEPRFYDFDTGNVFGGWYYFYEVEPTRTTATAKLSYFADDFLGAGHEFKFGVQYSAAAAAGLYGYNDYVYVGDSIYGANYGYGKDRQTFSYSGNSSALAGFVDDAVRVNNRLSLNLGLRYDHNRAYSAEQAELDASGDPTGRTFAETDFYTWKNFSPRLGFNWKATGDGKTVVKGHWGRYHRAIATGEYANVIGPNVKPYFAGTFNRTTGQFLDLVQISSNENLGVDPDYESPYTDQYILSVERELAKSLGVQLNYVYKRGRKFQAWRQFGGIYEPVTYVDDVGEGATGRSITLQQRQNSAADQRYEISNPEGMDTNIHAVSLGILRRMTDKWQLNTNITWMRAEGRLSGSGRTTELTQRGGLQFRSFGRNPNDFVNTYGRLTADVEWQFKAQFLYKLPWGLTTALNVSSRSGANLVRRANVASFTNQATTLLLQPRGENGRLPSVTFVDFRLQKDFRLGDKVNVSVFGDVINLLNEDSPQGVGSSTVTSSAYNELVDFVLPRRAILGAKLRF